MKFGQAGIWSLVVGSTLVSGIALAAGPVATTRVATADLDLQSTAGVAALHDRLQAAATVVCGLELARGYADRRRARRCVVATMVAEVRELRPDHRVRASAISARVVSTISGR